MSNEAQGLVRNLPLKAPQKPILMAYANYADQSGYCWPGIDTIAFDSGFSEPTVKRVRSELIKAGWMGTKRRFGTSAATRLNLPKIAAAAVDRGDRTRLNHDIEFGPGVDETAGQSRTDQPDPNVTTTTATKTKSPGRSRRDQSDPFGARSDQSDPVEQISLIPSTDHSDPLSISDPLEDPSVEGSRMDRRNLHPTKTPAEWATRLVLDLDFGRHKRPTQAQALELAALVEAAQTDHGLTESDIRRHCRTTLNEATKSGVSYLRGGLDSERLPMPRPQPERSVPRSQPVQQDKPVCSDDLTAQDLLSRGAKLQFLPSRLREATEKAASDQR